MKSHRSAPGGSGAGGSVVVITKTLHGNPHGRIFVQGGVPVKCAFGAGGGKSTFIFPLQFTDLNSSVGDDVRATTNTMMMLTNCHDDDNDDDDTYVDDADDHDTFLTTKTANWRRTNDDDLVITAAASP